MSADLLELFREKSEEFGTLKRVYCADPACSRFLGPQQESNSWSLRSPATKACPAAGCTTTTCLGCKNKVSGPLHRCAENAQDAQVLGLGHTEGWARCPGYANMIELSLGCYHMTCRCKTEFCYLCKKRWKTCVCPQWDERRLHAAAEARADAELRHQPARLPLPRRPVDAWAGAPPAVYPPPEAWIVRPAPIHPAQRTTHEQTTANIPRRPAATRVATYMPREAPPPVARREPQAAPDPSTAARAGTSSARPVSLTATLPPVSPVKPGPRPTPAPSTGVGNAPTGRDVLVRQWMDRLRVDHECAHEGWRYVRGADRCQTCHHNLPLYLFHCKGCQIKVCRRCRMNRL